MLLLFVSLASVLSLYPIFVLQTAYLTSSFTALLSQLLAPESELREMATTDSTNLSPFDQLGMLGSSVVFICDLTLNQKI